MTLPRGGWFISEAPTPNWDLVVACDFVGKPGLALIEARAHEGELDWAGKRPPERSVNSVANHDRIGLAIGEACSALDHIVPGVRISRDTHYQLANRVAYSWKLASMGVPVLLMSVGFTGGGGIADVGPPLRDDSHWRSVMHSYSEGAARFVELKRRSEALGNWEAVVDKLLRAAPSTAGDLDDTPGLRSQVLLAEGRESAVLGALEARGRRISFEEAKLIAKYGVARLSQGLDLARFKKLGELRDRLRREKQEQYEWLRLMLPRP